MIEIILSEDKYQYDIFSLVKAFFPEEEIKTTIREIGIRENDETADSVIDTLEDRITFAVRLCDNTILIKCCQGAEDVSTLIDIEGLSRIDEKNVLKRGIYSVLAEYTNRELPWGTLTGIRPTKLMMSMLDEGMSDNDIYEKMRSVYYTSDEKIRLGIDIAKRERCILEKISTNDGYSLYIGIPFCPTTCLYCSFTSYPIVSWSKRVDEYLFAVKKEIDYTRQAFAGKTLDSVYIGGGTPTTLSAQQFDDLIEYLRSSFDFSTVKEFTVEAGRPDSITEDKLRCLKRNGVTRISINPQTMNDRTLQIIGRRHTTEQIREAFSIARKCGHDNINMDLILGLPGETDEDVQYTMEEIKKLCPDSITIHSLAIKRAAGMNTYLKEHPEIKSIITDNMLKSTSKAAREMEMDAYYLYRQKNMTGNYENVGYAKAGKYGIYNILIMEEVQTIVACGAGTVTKRVYGDGRIERCDNVKDVDLYISKIDEMVDRKRKLFDYDMLTY